MKTYNHNLLRLLGMFPVVFMLLFTSSCNKKSNVYDSMRRIVSDNSDAVNSIQLEQVQLDSVQYSGDSFSWVQNGQEIYCLDRYYGWLYKFDKNGHLLKRALGYGRASTESTIRYSMIGTMSNDGELAIAGTSLDFEYFSKDLTVANRFLITVDQNVNYEATDFLAYTTTENCLARLYNGKFYESVATDDVDFLFGPDYVNQVCHIGVVDMAEGKPLKSEIQGLPSMFCKDLTKYVGLDQVTFDIDNQNNIYVCFAADPMIYVFNDNREPEYAFGCAGVDMDTDYNRCRSIDEIEAYRTNIEEKGYYSWLEYIDETGVCCRSYKKGATSESDGIQMYKDGKLIADCEVPKDFKVVGYIAPYYYSQVVGEKNGTMKVYRFKLD